MAPLGAQPTIAPVNHQQPSFTVAGRRFKLPRNTHEVMHDAKLTAREFFYLLSGFTLLFLAASLTAQDLSFMVNMVAFIYPAFFSIRALESMRPRELEKWLTYWVVFAFVNLGEMISDNLLWWFPYYWFMKSTFMVWCFLPIENNGSFYVYDNIIRPTYNSNGDEFEALIDSVKRNFVRVYNTMKDKAGEIAGRVSAEGAEESAADQHPVSPVASVKSPRTVAASVDKTSANVSPLAKIGENTAEDGVVAHDILAGSGLVKEEIALLTGNRIGPDAQTHTDSFMGDRDRPGGGFSGTPVANCKPSLIVSATRNSKIESVKVMSPLSAEIQEEHGAGGPGTADAGSETEHKIIYINGGAIQSTSQSRSSASSHSIHSNRGHLPWVMGPRIKSVKHNDVQTLQAEPGHGIGVACAFCDHPKDGDLHEGDEDPVDRVIRDWKEHGPPPEPRFRVRKATSG